MVADTTTNSTTSSRESVYTQPDILFLLTVSCHLFVVQNPTFLIAWKRILIFHLIDNTIHQQQLLSNHPHSHYHDWKDWYNDSFVLRHPEHIVEWVDQFDHATKLINQCNADAKRWYGVGIWSRLWS